MIECCTTVTADTYREWWRKVKRAALILLLVGIVGVVACLGVIGFYDDAPMHYTVITAFVFLSLLLIVSGSTVLRTINYLERRLGKGITYKYSFYKDYVDIAIADNAAAPKRVEYKVLKRTGESENYLYLYTTFNSAIIIDKKELGEENKKSILGYVAEAIEN